MTWLVTTGLLLLGVGLIIKGGDAFVDAASWMAEKTGIPKVIVGATVVSVATTMPEMIVSFFAASAGKVDMAVGNGIGSVSANTGLIMGIALLFMPMAVRRKEYLLKSMLMLGAALTIAAFSINIGAIGLVPNLILLSIFAVAMADNVKQAKSSLDMQKAEDRKIREHKPGQKNLVLMLPRLTGTGKQNETLLAVNFPRTIVIHDREKGLNIAKFVLGTAGIVIGSQLLVDNGSALAVLLGVPERIISVTLIAVGTSLPELITTLTAIAKRQGALSIGNIIGANIIDLAVIMPVSSLIAGKPLPISSQYAAVDIPACLLIGCIALVPMLLAKKFSRWQGIVLIGFYGCYIFYTAFGATI